LPETSYFVTQKEGFIWLILKLLMIVLYM